MESGGRIYHFFICNGCNAEWTTSEPAPYRGVVSVDEILDVHELLRQEVSFEDLLKPKE